MHVLPVYIMLLSYPGLSGLVLYSLLPQCRVVELVVDYTQHAADFCVLLLLTGLNLALENTTQYTQR